MKPVKSFTCRGKRWKYRVTRPMKKRGEADSVRKEVRISGDMKGEKLLDTIIHEALHVGCWDLDEEVVEEVATDIARLLWRLGYRNLNDIVVDED